MQKKEMINIDLYNQLKILAEELNIEHQYDWNPHTYTNEALIKNILEIKEKYYL